MKRVPVPDYDKWRLISLMKDRAEMVWSIVYKQVTAPLGRILTMMLHIRAALALATLGLTLAMPSGADPASLQEVPSYADSLAAFQAERKKNQKGSGMPAADVAVMKRATQDLAEAMPDPGLEVGERAPDFELVNALGHRVRLSEHLARGPVVLSFYRGAWCPYCNLQLRGLVKTLPHIKARGATLITVTPQTPDKSLEQVKKDGYPFEILSDLDNSVMQAYGLFFEVPGDLSDVYKRNFGLDLAEYNGKDRYVLPVPGTFVIDRRGLIRAAYANPDYRQRMEPAAILEALDRINGSPGVVAAP